VKVSQKRLLVASKIARRAIKAQIFLSKFQEQVEKIQKVKSKDSPIT
jgi:hypothetical protein